MQRRSPPYLPFLVGPPVFAPSLKPIAISDWLLPDTEAAAWLPAKRRLIADIGDRVCGGDIDGAAAKELLELLTTECPGVIETEDAAALLRSQLGLHRWLHLEGGAMVWCNAATSQRCYTASSAVQ